VNTESLALGKHHEVKVFSAQEKRCVAKENTWPHRENHLKKVKKNASLFSSTGGRGRKGLLDNWAEAAAMG